MGNLAQGLVDYGMKQGLEQGAIRTTLTDIKKLTLSTGWSVEKAMQMLDIPENERQKFMDMLKSNDSEASQ